MAFRKKIVYCLLLLLGTVSVYAQQHKSVIPYREVGGKMIVDLLVNGESRAFIFDTGGRTALTGEICDELGLQVKDSLVATDVNSKRAAYPIVDIRELVFPDRKIGFSHVPAMKLNKPSPFECFGADGLIGSEVLGQFIVEINGKTKTITLITAEVPSPASLRKMIPFAQEGGMPILNLQAGLGNKLLVLFDTGYPGFLSLKKSDYDTLKTKGALVELAEGFGGASIGVAGLSEGSVIHRVEFPALTVSGTRFVNVCSETSTPPYSLLGMKLLDYGKITIDYPRRRFYFEPYEEYYDLKSKNYDINLRVKDGGLVVASVWGEMRNVVQVGDRITRINGKPTGVYDFCESIITGIPELKTKKKIKLTVLTETGEKVIVYRKK